MPRPDLDSSSKPDAPAQLAADPDRLENLRKLQWQSLARHANQLPILVPAAACFVSFIVWDAVAPQLVLGWIGAITAVLLLRWGFSRNYRRFGIRVGSALKVMMALSACNGVIQGGGLLLFFPGLDLVQKAVVTMIMVCLASGAVSANAAYSRSFYAWAIPMFGALAAAWALSVEPDGIWIALLLVLFPLAQVLFVRDNEKVLRESFDIRYQRDEALRRLEEANSAKSRFLAAASHDLRQPLHTLSLYSAALSRKTDARTQEMAQEIGAAIQALGTLLDALLDISKLDSGAVQPEPKRFALHALLERLATAFRPLAAAKGLAFHADLQPVFVYSDPVLVEGIVRNLTGNAIKYTARGEVRLALAVDGERAVLTVSDTGPGIPKSKHEYVFEEFAQLHNRERDRSKGIGLGLAIVRRLQRLLQLELKLDSDTGRGATFRLWLPVASHPVVEEQSTKPAAAAPPVPLAPGTRVLVLDDDGQIRRATQALLESWDCEVVSTSTVGEAIAAMEAQMPSVLIADYRLSGGDTGADLVRRARALREDIVALLVTGDTTQELLHEAVELEVALLRKPVGEGALRQAIADAVKPGGTLPEGRKRGQNGMAVGGRRKASG